MSSHGFRFGWTFAMALAVITLAACEEEERSHPTAQAAEAANADNAETSSDNQVEPISTRLITERAHAFTDDVAAQIRVQPDGRRTEVINMQDASHLVMAEVTIRPGAWFPWHTHPGLALAAVKTGDLVYIYSDDCVERSYAGGESAFIDPGHGNVHTAYNPSDEHETVVIVTFVGASAEGPLTIPEDVGEQERLDERCGVTTPRPEAP